MYELFEHTADLGIRATAPDLPGVFAAAARGLLAATVEDVGSVEPRTEHRVTIPGTDREFLLFDFLRDLLYRFEVDAFLCAEATAAFTPDGLDATFKGEVTDPARHLLSHEVKAITYHGLTIEETDAGFVAEVIVDI